MCDISLSLFNIITYIYMHCIVHLKYIHPTDAFLYNHREIISSIYVLFTYFTILCYVLCDVIFALW